MDHQQNNGSRLADPEHVGPHRSFDGEIEAPGGGIGDPRLQLGHSDVSHN
jgi:hypothetical protein